MLIRIFKKHKKNKLNQEKKKKSQFSNLIFGAYGLKLQNSCLLTKKHIEATRRIFIRKTQKTCTIWIRNFPNYNKTKKPLNIRMGKGKGKIYLQVCRIFKGTILFELDNIPTTLAQFLIKKATKKLPTKSIFIKKKSIFKNNLWFQKPKVINYYKKL